MTAPASAPIMEPQAAAEFLSRRRQRGTCTVALANGCFDLLHVGHVRYLLAAKAEADVLVVGVNSDDAVGAIKGLGRPLLPASLRAALVASVRGVDLVTVFAQQSADALIRLLRPDVHCKGTDYAAGVPEQATVRSVGGRTAIVGDPKDHSTRQLIEQIRKIAQ